MIGIHSNFFVIKCNEADLFGVLESVGRAYKAEGVFIVNGNGLIASSWDSSGKPSTGLNVKFRPYYKMAMQGKENIYAAVSLARGDRALYFTSPIYSKASKETTVIGAIVGRTASTLIDEVLRGKPGLTLLLSPQGVVFAGSIPKWIGFLSDKPDAERLKAIRELKQFGNMFENREPSLLPFSVEPGLQSFEGAHFAVTNAFVQWNDPFGHWKLVHMEDLSRTVPMADMVWISLGAGLVMLLIELLIFTILRSHHTLIVTGQELAASARAQKDAAERKSRLASAALRLQQAGSEQELSKIFLEETHKILNALQGVVYVVDNDRGPLVLAGSYACAEPPTAELVLGEGLLGQCAMERRTLVIETAPYNFTMIHSGLGETRPAAVMMTPVLLNESLLGVIEIGMLYRPGDGEREQFMELAGLLAMNLEIVGRATQNQAILSAAQTTGRAGAEETDCRPETDRRR
ncbi:MAG: GAF domain-containing protein [Deltaproteobacteria bacterium]|nr:GAF domain-containing protein [Deltaproteobacteria bacterium]